MSPLLTQTYQVVLRQLEEMPQFLKRALADLSLPLLQQQPPCDKMPLLEHLCHVRDCDPDLYGLRIRRVLREAAVPLLEPVQVGAWPKERAYLSQEPSAVIEDFEQMRAALVGELRGLSEAELTKAGQRVDGTKVSVLEMVAQIAEHDWDHKWRIAAILKEFAARAAQSPNSSTDGPAFGKSPTAARVER